MTLTTTTTTTIDTTSTSATTLCNQELSHAPISVHVVCRFQRQATRQFLRARVLGMSSLSVSSAAAIKGLIDNADIPILSRYLQIMDILEKDNMVSVLFLHSSAVMTHPANRGKLGLNPHNVHLLGKRVKDIGADSAELHGAVAFEMSNDATVHMDQLQFNQDLVKVSDGLLSPLTGKGKYLSVGGGHMVAFTRAVAAGCKTPIVELADKNGKLDAHLLQNDSVFSTMISSGYKWNRISNVVDQAIPGLADFCQRSLNSTNSISAEQSELEVMSSIAQFANNQAKQGQEPDYKACTEAATAGNPPCKPYAVNLATFAKLYGGGPGAPIVVQLDKFAKKHSRHMVLGSEFTGAVVSASFGDIHPCPRVRAGLLGCKLTSPRAVDGVARLLSKSDVSKMTSKDMAKRVVALEADLERCEKLVLQLDQVKALPDGEGMDVYSLLMIRSITHLLNKTKQTFLKAEYKDMKQIMGMFHDELNAKANNNSSSSASPLHCKEHNPSAVVKAAPSFAEVSSPEHIAAQKNFTVQSVVYKKAMGASAGLFIIDTIADIVTVKTRTIIPHVEQKTFEIKLENFLKEWSLFGGDCPELVESSIVAASTVTSMHSFPADVAKVGFFAAIRDYHAKHAADVSSFYFSTNPTSLCVKTGFKKDALALVPLTPLANIVVSATAPAGVATSNKVTINKVKCEIFVTKPSTWTKSSQAGHSCVQPYFWVGVTSDKQSANMATYNAWFNDHYIPVLYNTRNVEKHERLCVLAPQKAKTTNLIAEKQAYPKKKPRKA